MTQNTTKNDKREQCDTKHNALKIYLTRKNLLRRTLFLQPTRQRVYRTDYVFAMAKTHRSEAAKSHIGFPPYVRT